MGNYNPHIPFILGEEWVPIRDENVSFSPAINAVEYGHQFVLATSRTLEHAKFYSSHPPMYTGASGQVWVVAVYPTGTEGLSGPTSRLVVPCTNATATGAGLSPSGNVTANLVNPSLTTGIQISGSTGGGQIDTSFGFSLFPILNGKRILRINFLYLLQNLFSSQTAEATGSGLTIGPNTFPGIGSTSFGAFTAIGNTVPLDDPQFINLGDVNRTAFSTAPSVTQEMAPWNYPNLLRLEPGAASGLHYSMDFRSIASTVTYILNYVALEVFYCEEQRVAYGCRGFIDFGQNFNRVPMRTCTGQALNPVLSPGNYTVTVATMDPGAFLGGAVRDDPPGTVDGIRELYQLTDQAGVKVSLPFPIDQDAVGKQFTAEDWQILPQISLHTSGGTVNEVHAYGRQAISQVFGSVTATQEIFDTTPGTASYPQVRFFARRFGDTTVPLRLDSPTITGAGLSVQITPAEFDLLDEVSAGWKEVSLRFTTAPTMGTGTNPQWRWSAIGELAGNRWEVLGAVAPALSGVPGNPLNQVPSAERLTTATYGALTAGSSINLGWIPGVSPVVTATTDDPMSDAFLIFSQDPPTITGLSISNATQEVVGIGLDCDVDPCCIPTDIVYNRITWGLPVNTGVASDDFNRTVAAGSWGTASDGHTWTTSGTASNFSVDGAEGLIIPTATASDRIAWVNVGGLDQDVQTQFKVTDTAESSSLNVGLVARLTDASNYYGVEARYNSTSTITLLIRKRVAGVATDLVSITVPTLNPNIDAWRYLRFQVSGNSLRAKMWGEVEPEPDWMLITTDSSLTTGNNAGTFARDNTSAAAPSTFMFDSFTVNPPDYWFGSYELQRQDTVDTDWQTIMRATGVATTGFSDYEARVGVLSTYRIRGVNVYDFAGPWSSEVSITIPSPGVSGGCLDGGHVLIFTSNERQDGSINLAYSSVWLDRVQEDFTFAEAGFVQMQAMYNRDFFTAFRPTERGGEQFQRTVLVQAAAISPPTLADFTSLRDMAWEDVSYICVRDEDANRWFATVIVPSGRVTHSRKLYMAPVTVIEVTDTPSEADPS